MVDGLSATLPLRHFSGASDSVTITASLVEIEGDNAWLPDSIGL